MILVLDLINSMKKLKSILDRSKYLKCVRSDNPVWDKFYKDSSGLYIKMRNVNLKDLEAINTYVTEIEELNVNMDKAIEAEINE